MQQNIKERLELKKKLVQAIARNDVKLISEVKKKLTGQTIVISSFLDFLQWSEHFDDPTLNFEFDQKSKFVKFLEKLEVE